MSQALYEMLLDHVVFLKSCEPTFGHATALAKYGRKFLPRPAKTNWLALGPKGACFNNAAAFALTRTDVYYAEGYAVEPEVPIPIQHAWLVDGAGEVIDPTWGDTRNHVYFGMAFSKLFVTEALALTENTPGILVNMHLMRRRFREPQALEGAIAEGRAESLVEAR